MTNNNNNNKIVTSLPENLHFILIGIMLGDGSIYRFSPTSNSRFEMSFGSNYKQFAESISNLFSDYINSSVKTIEFKGKNKIYTNFKLKTKTLPIFNLYHTMFYNYNSEIGKYVKIIPYNILDVMNPVVLAYLIMTDGNYDKNRKRIRIYTNSYSKEDVERLAKIIKLKLDIYVGVLHDRKDQWILTIGAKQ
jgi:LAGLIDADG DNA endonuclease family